MSDGLRERMRATMPDHLGSVIYDDVIRAAEAEVARVEARHAKEKAEWNSWDAGFEAGLKDTEKCKAIGPHHGDPCNGGRIQSPNAQFTQDCPACKGTGFPPTVTNAAGGKQSKISTRFDLMPPDALIRIAEVLAKGSHYGKDNWRLIPKGDHLNHAMNHLAMYLKGDTSEDHLGNATCRLMFAIETK